MKGYLVLQDKTLFEGNFLSHPSWTGVGEVVFNTSMVGYQEVVTDPSYYNQIIVMTAPEQGNYGASVSERESKKIWAEGFICLELNQTQRENRHQLLDELNEFKKPALSGVDTRTLTLHLRERGTPWGAVLSAANEQEAIAKALSLIEEKKSKVSSDWVYDTSTHEPQFLKGQGQKGRVAVYDFGAKNSIVDQLLIRFSEVAVFNSRTEAAKILDWAPQGIVLSNGPGNPEDVQVAPGEIKKLLGHVPIFGICMGHQVLALALGGKTYKLKFGHRGSNHPVKNLQTGDIYMTAQNHGYAVHEDLPTGVIASQINLYDKTIEGIECAKLKAWSVQYHPEAGPGPHDSRVLFDYFAKKIL